MSVCHTCFYFTCVLFSLDSSHMSILSPDLAVPHSSTAATSQFHIGINLLACFQTLTALEDANISPTRAVMMISKLGKQSKEKVGNYHAAYRFSSK